MMMKMVMILNGKVPVLIHLYDGDDDDNGDDDGNDYEDDGDFE
jgi:hypothetical protein